VVDISRYVGGTLVLFYSFTVLYMLAPRHRTRFSQIWIPALVVSLLLQVGQACFVNIVPKLINYSAIYGAMGSMMFLLLWVYITGVIIIIGGCLCASLSHLRSTPHLHPQHGTIPLSELDPLPTPDHPNP
jgi:YihY family inner membrane protein